MLDLKTYEIIILDCDGVVFNSNFLKLDAFRDALIAYDHNLVDKFIEHVKYNFGTSRYHLIRLFIEDYLNQDFHGEIYRLILNKYSLNCVKLYEIADLTDNFHEFIEKYKEKKLFIASGSDQNELRHAFNNRGLARYFSGIFGSPTKKSEIVKKITSKSKNAILIGDSKADYHAAKESKIDFLFMSQYTSDEIMKIDINFQHIKNLGDLI